MRCVRFLVSWMRRECIILSPDGCVGVHFCADIYIVHSLYTVRRKTNQSERFDQSAPDPRLLQRPPLITAGHTRSARNPQNARQPPRRAPTPPHSSTHCEPTFPPTSRQFTGTMSKAQYIVKSTSKGVAKRKSKSASRKVSKGKGKS